MALNLTRIKSEKRVISPTGGFVIFWLVFGAAANQTFSAQSGAQEDRWKSVTNLIGTEWSILVYNQKGACREYGAGMGLFIARTLVAAIGG
jgi:hypothetical protein